MGRSWPNPELHQSWSRTITRPQDSRLSQQRLQTKTMGNLPRLRSGNDARSRGTIRIAHTHPPSDVASTESPACLSWRLASLLPLSKRLRRWHRRFRPPVRHLSHRRWALSRRWGSRQSSNPIFKPRSLHRSSYTLRLTGSSLRRDRCMEGLRSYYWAPTSDLKWTFMRSLVIRWLRRHNSGATMCLSASCLLAIVLGPSRLCWRVYPMRRSLLQLPLYLHTLMTETVICE